MTNRMGMTSLYGLTQVRPLSNVNGHLKLEKEDQQGEWLMPYKDPKHPNRAYSDWKYRNTERGFVMKCIAAKFRPSQKKWRPEMDKKEMWRLYMNHIADMKKKHSNSDGRLCAYCEKPYTFKSKMGSRGTGYQGRGTQIKTNFSIDRWDPRFTYTPQNVIFCCVGCNDRKHDSNPDDWKNFIKIGEEDV